MRDWTRIYRIAAVSLAIAFVAVASAIIIRGVLSDDTEPAWAVDDNESEPWDTLEPGYDDIFNSPAHLETGGIYYANGELKIDVGLLGLIEITHATRDDTSLLYKFWFSGDTGGISRYMSIHDKYMRSLVFDGKNGLLTVFANTPLIYEASAEENHYILSFFSPKDKYDKIVYIDPGHGGFDPGSDRGGYLEKDLNLSVALALYEMFENSDCGIKAFLSRDTDIHLDKSFRAVYGSQVADAIVSIHCNTYDSSSVHGTETLYDPKQILSGTRFDFTSEWLAQAIQTNLSAATNSRDRGIKERHDLVLISLSDVPAVIVEVGYISNKDELKKIIDPSYQVKIAEGIYNGILEAFGIQLN